MRFAPTAAQRKALELWADALESGDFKQARDALRKDDAMCCLGVACEVYRRRHKKGVWDKGSFRVDDKCGTSMAPSPVSEWLGIAGEQVHFVTANDKEGCSFEDIAQTIRGLLHVTDKR